MNNEIKEILNTIKEQIDYLTITDLYCCLDENECKCLLNYITNLQQQNEDLKLQLRGTTHCYDEFEHRELKKQIKELQYKYNKALNDLVIVDRLSEMLKCLQEQIKDFGTRGCDD